MPEYVLLRRIVLGPKHSPTGKTRHIVHGKPMSTAVELQIVRYADDPGFYLLYLDGDGSELNDSYEDTLDRVMEQADWEFNVKPHEWEVVAD
jgi:hypothetical protein